MSLVQSSDPSHAKVPLSLLSLRPMTSHARIEGGASSYTPSEHHVTELRPIARKNFLPQLPPKSTTSALKANDTDSDTYRQMMWTKQANILVTVRLRPLLSHDRDCHEIVKVVGNKEVVVLARRLESLHSPVRRYSSGKVRYTSASPLVASGFAGKRSREKRYAFDYVFTPRNGQQKVYQHTTKFLIHGVLNGFNATVFAYGCTGAGKTYTMLGTPEEPGIMARTLEDLFRNIERVHADPAGRVQYRVTVSFLEVYNENIRDLLSASSSCSSASSMPTSEFLDLREDPVRGSVVAGLSEVEANDAQGVMKLLRKGNRYRSQESTAANSVSSRSHAVLQVHIEQREKLTSCEDFESSDAGPDDENGENLEIKFGKLSLVDLAGSERAAVTQNRGQRLLEGANINRSLLALGNCINALGEKGASSGSFVPYRDSKLTRLLKDSLGGNCRTVMIANVGLAASSVEETMNTLKYANRAKNIKTTVRKNIGVSDPSTRNHSGLVAHLQQEIATLKKALLQQEDLRRQSPIHHEPRWVESKTFSDRVQDTDNNNSDEEERKSTKLREARLYITESFQERRRLRHALLQLEHQIQRRVQEMQSTQSVLALDSTSSDSTSSLTYTSKEQRRVNATEAANTTLVNSGEPEDADDQLFVSLTCKRRVLVQQLAQNEKAMNEFRADIERSPVMERNELIREILLLEYRIGDLEIDKMQLQTLRDLQMDGSPSSVEDLRGNNDDLDTERLDTRLISSSSTEQEDLQPQVSDGRSVHLPEITSSRTAEPKGFLEELRGHLYPGKLNSHRGNNHPATHKVAASPVRYRKHWGLHLNNASLPYIRLKKKYPVPLYVEPTTLGSPAAETTSGALPLTEPYLKSLKNRRKRSKEKNGSTTHGKNPLTLK